MREKKGLDLKEKVRNKEAGSLRSPVLGGLAEVERVPGLLYFKLWWIRAVKA